VFLVTDGYDLETRDRAVSLAARHAGVRHVVKLSTLDVRTGIGTGTWHARGEAAVRESGVAFTFVQAAGFMSNALGWSESIRRAGVLRSSTGGGRIAFIHPYVDALVEIWRAVREGRLDTVTDGIKRVTGREPIPFDQWAAENAASFQ
jgi:uncharacterized protein YbjT (DUF2867 family)